MSLTPGYTLPMLQPQPHNERFFFRVLLGVFVVGLSAGVFSKTVLVNLFMGIELVFRYFLAVFFAFYITDRLVLKRKITYFDLIILILLIVPIYSAFSAKREFGQPILMGLLAQNYLLMYLAGTFIWYLVRIRWMTIESLRYSFLALGWISLILFTGTELFADPMDYLDSEFVRSKDTKGGYFFKYFTYFITFGGLYHAICFFFKRDSAQLLLFLPFLFFMIVINNGRTDMVVFLSTLGLIFFKHQSFKQILVYTFYVIMGAAASVAILVTFFPEEATILWDMYSSYFTVLTGQESEDSSATSRLLQIGVALDFLLSNPDAIVFGAGKVSGNFDVPIMRIVNPVDIGLVGLIFNHGLVGMVIMYSQFVFAYNFTGKVKFAANDMFFITLKYYMFMILIQSFFKGPLFYLPGQLIIIVGMLYAYRYFDLEVNWLTEKMGQWQQQNGSKAIEAETQTPSTP
ncbi:MAG: hypothetical protein GC205_04240 [Bacteroidetes bacterium]|nr:hypothetical protein [Bacteroidota bacterium]